MSLLVSLLNKLSILQGRIRARVPPWKFLDAPLGGGSPVKNLWSVLIFVKSELRFDRSTQRGRETENATTNELQFASDDPDNSSTHKEQ